MESTFRAPHPPPFFIFFQNNNDATRPICSAHAAAELRIRHTGNFDGDGRIAAADAVIALWMVVRGEHNDGVDMNGRCEACLSDSLMVWSVPALWTRGAVGGAEVVRVKFGQRIYIGVG
jgi:hypothetical protein